MPQDSESPFASSKHAVERKQSWLPHQSHYGANYISDTVDVPFVWPLVQAWLMPPVVYASISQVFCQPYSQITPGLVQQFTPD